jgi:hypothetical protein
MDTGSYEQSDTSKPKISLNTVSVESALYMQQIQVSIPHPDEATTRFAGHGTSLDRNHQHIESSTLSLLQTGLRQKYQSAPFDFVLFGSVDRSKRALHRLGTVSTDESSPRLDLYENHSPLRVPRYDIQFACSVAPPVALDNPPSQTGQIHTGGILTQDTQGLPPEAKRCLQVLFIETKFFHEASSPD